MDITVSLPLDHDGFLPRECPHCVQQFKWHNGPANEEAERHSDGPTYYCPFCGQPAGPDSWFTREQAEYLEGVAAPALTRLVDEELSRAFKGLGSKNIKIKKTGHLDLPDEPMPMVEADDMTIIVSPCHPYEPVKVPETATGPYHCLVCGQAFAV